MKNTLKAIFDTIGNIGSDVIAVELMDQDRETAERVYTFAKNRE